MDAGKLTPQQYKKVHEAVKFRIFRSQDFRQLKDCVSEHAALVCNQGHKPLALRDLALEYAHRGIRPSHGADLYVAWAICEGNGYLKSALTVKWERLAPYEEDIAKAWWMLELHYLRQLEKQHEQKAINK